ncbi:MAG: hypothetical protein WBX11_13910 [Thiobacillaceae bacterium]
MRTTAITATLLCLMGFTSVWADNLPTIREVYAAAGAGHLTQTRTMVDQVLAAKPDSAKGHFVKAELCAAQLDRSCARDELASAKRLEPGLTFANPAAVRKLETLTLGATPLQRSTPNSESGFNWTWVALGLGIIALLWWVVSIATRRAALNANLAYAGGAMVSASPTNTMSGVSPGYGAPISSGGFGMGLGKSLATGAALGAGMVAGEALADSFLHRGQSTPLMDTPVNAPSHEMTSDLGGNDFGIGNADSWDDSSSDLGSADLGGSDW